MKKPENEQIRKIEKALRRELDRDRYQHTMGVMYTGAALAMRYEQDLEKAQLAGLLHDCAKCIPNDKKIKLCRKYDIEISEAEKKSPFLLHAKLGAELARRSYGITDEAVLSAIRFHTTGRADMTMLEKIVFIADYIEPMRSKAENLQEIRSMAFQDLDRAVYMTLRDTMAYLQKGTGPIDQTTAQAFAFYDEKFGLQSAE